MNLKSSRSLLENKTILNLSEFNGSTIAYADFLVAKDADLGKITLSKLKISCCLFMAKKH